MARSICLLCVFLVAQIGESSCQADEFNWEVQSTGTNASLRGLAVVSDEVLWASGSQATVLRTLDGGRTWLSVAPKGFDKLEFRSIAAWDANTAIIASAGTPAVILKTVDGGTNWRQVYHRQEETAFFDGLQFFDRQKGIAFSDPIDGHWLIVTTSDGGDSWSPRSSSEVPIIRMGEAAFAASNSALVVAPGGLAWIGSGGTQSPTSRVYRSTNHGFTWNVSDCPIASAASSGVFSLAFDASRNLLVAVGGDYRPDHSASLNAAYSSDGGITWAAAEKGPAAFRSAVVIQPTTGSSATRSFVAVGPTGTDISSDGRNWRIGSSVGFHAIGVSPRGKLFAVGSEGRFGVSPSNVSPVK